jgi:hypothetical protein
MKLELALENLDDYSFEMFSEQGSVEIRKRLKLIIEEIYSKTTRVNKIYINEVVKDLLEEVSNIGFPEVNDTEPEGHIEYWINKCLDENRYPWKVYRGDW